MEGSDGSPPQSLCMIRAAELFPKPQMEKEDSQLTVPFQELAGESVRYLGRTDDGVLALSNYRMFVLNNSINSETSVPLGLIETAQARDLFHLIINCKDASTVKCSFETAEQCSEWQRRIQLSVGVPGALESLFAFPFCSWTCDGITTNGIASLNGGGVVGCSKGVGGGGEENHPSSACSMPDYSDRLQRATRCENDFMREVERLGFDDGSWRISDANKDFKLCPSYPKKILVPSCISDEMLNGVANFRGSRRLPAIVWRHRRSGAVLARCSQPEVGWLGWRNSKDEELLKAIADACAFDRGEQKQQRRPEQQNNNNTIITTTTTSTTNASGQKATASDESTTSSPEDGNSHDGGEVVHVDLKKVLIVDARSYTSAVTNRARGGGCECIEYYPYAEIEFMNLGNIHVIRKSFHSLRQLCASPPDVPNWLGLLEKTMWLQHLSGLLAASMTVCHAMEKKGRPVLVHCSDGWDRTPQIVATAQLCLDPFYRTVEGFRILVEREWLSYGHKFADRCGHGPGSDELNERCPVFLQWLDLVHQIHKQFPCSFEFSMGYLIKLAQHSHSCLFGTFLCNTYRDRMENSVFERTFSVWPFLSGPMYRNPLYVPNREKVLWPAHNVRDLYLWTEVYLGSLGNQNCIDFPSNNVDGLHGSMSPIAKTRSYGDLISAGIIQNGISRRSSDPNMIVDPNLTIGSNSENNSIVDTQSEREDSPDIEPRQLENIAIELNNHDHEENILKSLQEIHKKEQNHTSMKNNYEPQHYQNQLNGGTATTTTAATKAYVENMTANNDTFFFSSPQNTNNNLKQNVGCELKPTSISSSNAFFKCSTTNAPLTSVACAVASTTTTTLPENITKNGYNGTTTHQNCDNGMDSVDGNGTKSNGTIHRIGDLDLNLMRNSEIDDSSPLYNVPITTSSTDADSGQENLWHGSITTSTDTLVPIDAYRQQQQQHNSYTKTNGDNSNGITRNAENADLPYASPAPIYKNGVDSLLTALKAEESLRAGDLKFTANSSNNTNNSANFSILPEVHTSINSRPNVLSNSSSNASVSSTSSSLNNLNKISSNNVQQQQNNSNANFNKSCDNNKINDDDDDKNFSQKCLYPTLPSTGMEESILILPEHDKLDISPSGKCETITNNVNSASASTTPLVAPYYFSNTSGAVNPAQRRRRTSSSNSRRDGLTLNRQQTNGSTISRFSLPGVRSLPMTPPGLPERPQIAISCPDGLAHALSEQNIRLQQIVHEHKLREDLLLREIHDMRIALFKKICPSCNAPATNDEQCSVLDNIENASICSWEAVEERSGASSCASSSMPPNSAGATSVLWVPDHAVSRCTSCQTEFWLGRRKHHCRSCGQIFCADCSEFWAPLPDEKLFTPVRLCGPCYHSVTTRMQQQNRSFIVTNSNGNHINTLTTMTSTMNSNAINNTSNNVLLTTSAPMLQPQRQPNVIITPNTITNGSIITTTTTNTQIIDSNMPPHIPIGNNITASVAN